MSTKGTADIVFCIDASASMQPCIDALRTHIGAFLEGLKTANYSQWDWRMEFIAHNSSESHLFHRSHAYSDVWDLLHALYPQGADGQGGTPGGALFTTDLERFKTSLGTVEVRGDEAPLVALDFCLDLPWRPARDCHRVVILLTDEAFETGVRQAWQRPMLAEIQQKLMALRVMLFIVAPESDVFTELAAVDKCEYQVVESTGDGLATVNFRKILGYIGKSISVSVPSQDKASSIRRGVFNQPGWVPGGVWDFSGS